MFEGRPELYIREPWELIEERLLERLKGKKEQEEEERGGKWKGEKRSRQRTQVGAGYRGPKPLPPGSQAHQS